MLLIVSSGPSVVPRLIGLPLPEAERRLRDSGLRLSFRAVASKRPSGVVVATEPGPGKPVAPGAAVTVSVSSGPGRLSVPSLLWARADEARARVRKAGFVARVFEVPSAEPAGIVVAQSPQPGSELDRGSRVRLDVSTGAAARPFRGRSTCRGSSELHSTQLRTGSRREGSSSASSTRSQVRPWDKS